ncbi:MAG: hypothetical protein WKF47_12740 [Geodermatophilaceae bacterium]
MPSVLADPDRDLHATPSSTVIDDGFWTAADICTAEYAEACTELGIE